MAREFIDTELKIIKSQKGPVDLDNFISTWDDIRKVIV